MTFGINVLHNIRHNGKKIYFGMEFAISISYVTLAAMSIVGIVLASVIPAVAPVITRIFSVLASFVSSPYGLATGSTAIVTIMRACAC